ncbi:hypothetical protein OESDEN_08902 [Oesophagostomum dentatum]|uniref:VWFA domain-containing protein n=1 Tax=Oesophagostomum dentatum TaxID=61180 RepID=A0A0B1T621_OESDE|nr:hypothetical protein OESDEN_08902 [Oesophagostomum dentatum]
MLSSYACSHAKVEAVQPELVPASVKVWNLVGAEANFINNAVKTATNPNCDQTTQRNGTTAASLTTANPFATTDVPTSTDDEDLELSEDNSTHSFGTTPTLDNTSTNSSEEVPTNTTAETFIPTDTSINDTTAAFTDETTDTAEPISKNATIDTDTSISANVTTADAEDEDAFTSATVDTATSISTDATTDDIEDVSTSAPTDDAEDAPTNATVDTATSIFTNTTADDVEAISNNATTDDTEDLLTNTTAYTIEPIPNNESIDTATSISTNAAANNAEGFLTNATTDNMVDIPTNATLEAANTTEHIPAATEQQTQDINGTATLATATDTSAHEFAEHCNVAAHFDMEKGECVCNNPEMDAKKRNPREFYRYSEGDVCYSCQGLNSTTAVVFILDESGTVKRSGWRAQKTFMQQLLDLMGDIKVGIVVIAGDSYVAVPLDDYRKNKKAIEYV